MHLDLNGVHYKENQRKQVRRVIKCYYITEQIFTVYNYSYTVDLLKIQVIKKCVCVATSYI